MGTLGIWQARCAKRPSHLRISEAFAEGVQLNHFAAERGRLGEERGIGGERDAQAGLHQVGREAGRVGWVRGDGGDLGEQVLGGDRSALDILKLRDDGGSHVWGDAASISPERKGAAPKRALVVVKIRHQTRKTDSWTACWRVRHQCRFALHDAVEDGLYQRLVHSTVHRPQAVKRCSERNLRTLDLHRASRARIATSSDRVRALRRFYRRSRLWAGDDGACQIDVASWCGPQSRSQCLDPDGDFCLDLDRKIERQSGHTHSGASVRAKFWAV